MSDIIEHKNEFEYKLEELLYETSICELLETLAHICYEKEEHLLTNWQDKETAKIWHRAGLLIDGIANRLDN